jgi:hypothetical protein
MMAKLPKTVEFIGGPNMGRREPMAGDGPMGLKREIITMKPPKFTIVNDFIDYEPSSGNIKYEVYRLRFIGAEPVYIHSTVGDYGYNMKPLKVPSTIIVAGNGKMYTAPAGTPWAKGEGWTKLGNTVLDGEGLEGLSFEWKATDENTSIHSSVVEMQKAVYLQGASISAKPIMDETHNWQTEWANIVYGHEAHKTRDYQPLPDWVDDFADDLGVE